VNFEFTLYTTARDMSYSYSQNHYLNAVFTDQNAKVFVSHCLSRNIA